VEGREQLYPSALLLVRGERVVRVDPPVAVVGSLHLEDDAVAVPQQVV
jgi:hypothetical protein